MKIKVVFLAVSALVLTSCGSGKNVVKSTPNEVDLEPKEEKMPELPQLEQIQKPLKTTTTHTEIYIQKFAPIAVKKMHEHGIPASITLAQGVLESGSGRSPLALRSNNHFGIKCHRGWQGHSVTHDDDEKGECFRKYKYPETSYEDHSQFLLTRERYASLFKLKNTDYKGWAYGLKRAGYATDRKYPQKLISIIKKYNLDAYDKIQPDGSLAAETPSYEIGSHKVEKGDTLYSIARKYNTSVQRLKEVNGLTDNNISIGQELMVR
ncbi:glucosaminidase domain-containing protein [Tenacibaculum tangerinum]|uniref:Peptidoglycan hydrolase n=1 Tax=Tenacibaculum tangerinum TaxID=3038772 RepID=A0ABY8L0W3_9FLAO|nr:glucosaminidase domain-containing protein [Tenacibaculum tangerinum]WGH75112.1 glucosaminidase domain-containing protein [Tenacibaculum tangerinum]